MPYRRTLKLAAVALAVLCLAAPSWGATHNVTVGPDTAFHPQTRPNGFLWPTIVRFTPSRVVVEIQQISTGITNTYDLPAVPSDSESLSGLQDRTGFLP